MRRTGTVGDGTMIRPPGESGWKPYSQIFMRAPRPLRTYYDVLNVSEEASDEVIRAAYRALSLRHHPDRNGNSPEAVKTMQLLNDAHAALADPKRRGDYDAKLRYLRAQAATPPSPSAAKRAVSQSVPQPKTAKREWWRTLLSVLLWDVRVTLFVGFIAFAGINSLFEKKRPSVPYSSTSPRSLNSSTDYTPALPRPARPSYTRPPLSPFGYPWPLYAAYLQGAPSLASGGLSTVTVDNTRNTSAVHLKLVSLSRAQAFPVRECYIPGGASFRFSDVATGSYDVRYRDLDYGGYSKTETFALYETPTASGTTYSTLSLTLYKVANGNMHTESIDPSQF